MKTATLNFVAEHERPLGAAAVLARQLARAPAHVEQRKAARKESVGGEQQQRARARLGSDGTQSKLSANVSRGLERRDREEREKKRREKKEKREEREEREERKKRIEKREERKKSKEKPK